MSLRSAVVLVLPVLAALIKAAPNAQAPAAAFKVGKTVVTSSGPIEGHAASWQPEVSEYLGVPFAVPPVGPLRWMAPKPFIGNKTVDAAKFSPDCAANVAAPLGSQIDYTGTVADIVKGSSF
jgi:cholinesterase